MSADYCAKYYDLRYMFLKIAPRKVVALLPAASKLALFSVSGLKDEKSIKKRTYMKTETLKLYSRVF